MWDILLQTWNYDPILRIHLLSLAFVLIQLKTLEPKVTSVNKPNKASTSTSNYININNDKMKINIKTSTGVTFTVDDIKSTDIILKVKYKIQVKEKILIEEQCLLYADNELDNDKTLSDYNIEGGSDLQLVIKK